MFNKIKKKINRKFKDKDFSEIFKKGASGFFISIVGRNFGFAQQLVITNFYGAAAFGVFRVCFSLLSLIGIFGRFGVDMAISRFVAQYRKQGRYDLVNEIFQIGIKMVIPLALLLSVGLFFTAPLISEHVYHKPYTLYIQVFAIGIFFFILSGIIEEGIRGLKKITAYSWINNVSTQAFSIAILLIGLLFTSSDIIVNISYVIGLILTFILGAYYWFKYIPYEKIKVKTISRKELLAVSLPMLSAKYLTTLYTWLGTLILAAYVADDSVGIFNGAARMSAFATMPLIAINNISGPKFAEAFGENDQKAINKTVRLSTRLIFWTCMPIMAAFFLFPKLIMGVYGSEFISQEAIFTFAVINLGQVVNFMTGPVTQLLNMTGRQLVTQRYAILTTITSIVLSVLLIPSMGMLGAAIATAIARTVLNLGCSLHIYFTMGINTIYNPLSDVVLLFNKAFGNNNKSDK
ncbi:MAG: flippase [Bacteroidetes bacterium]|nr:flippase [Bacteroidota bacterium]MBP7398283.1 flippase [Chitinophagales bacterium]MBK8680801.1 flippase [Bacteroidota bacterium]MBP8753601.1 flippase [Chitinophagales bacterium]MBP9188631.1 flippase [Chitinophagales bacterium]